MLFIANKFADRCIGNLLINVQVLLSSAVTHIVLNLLLTPNLRSYIILLLLLCTYNNF